MNKINDGESPKAREPATTAAMLNWAGLLDAVKADAALKTARAALIASARTAAGLPILPRVYRLEDVGQHRTGLDGRSKILEDKIRATFAFAMSDCSAGSTLSNELPLLAAAFRLTGDLSLKERVTAQLAETATWSPFQRPGWTCYAPGRRLPPDGKDGNWLATGTLVRAVALTLELMPPGSIDTALRNRLKKCLADEIASVVDDWKTKRPWFVQARNAITNQWVLPTEGLIQACLVLGADKYRDDYELGVKNMLQALDAHGKDGEFEEGVGYAAFTVNSMLHTARAMAIAGDQRLIHHPFLGNFSTWFVQHLQPGRVLINSFDSFGPAVSRDGKHGNSFRQLLCLLAVATGDRVARWAISHQFDGPSDDLVGLLTRTLPPAGKKTAPSLFAKYERATRVNWRNSWDDAATGVWVRGGHALDQHDHQDRGHVNLIAKGKAILIESGTPAYHNPKSHSHYASGLGHNVLQIGTRFPEPPYDVGGYLLLPGWQKPQVVAPITVHKLDAQGGNITVDGTRCYDGLQCWRRTVAWTAAELTVEDEVKLADTGNEIFIIRWHLGTEQEVSISGSGTRFTVRWKDADMEIQGSAPLLVAQMKLPDHTLVPRTWVEPDPDHLHTCIEIRTGEKLNEVKLLTRVTPQT